MEPPGPTPKPATVTPPSSFPKLEILSPAALAQHLFYQPIKRIHEGPDVSRFLISQAYRDIGMFIMQLNRALCPRKKAQPASTSTQFFPLDDPNRRDPESVLKLQGLLKSVGALIDEAPPDTGPRRFGNVSFRTWHKLLEERVDALLQGFLPAEVVGDAAEGGSENKRPGPLVELREYFVGGFGSAQRLDFGTGHELSFLAFLGCLWKLGYFEGGEGDDGEIERSIVLGVLEPYINVIRRLILTYTLEPAGSHGVWGLDDHFFLSYVFGSAQLTRPISPSEPMPLEGSAPGVPRCSDIVKPDAVALHRKSNMYFSAVGFINDVKKGPFGEHSPILYDVSGIKDGWGKINKGMIKMFNAEVLSKLPVVQHFPFGSLFSWNVDPKADFPAVSAHMAAQPHQMSTYVTSAVTGNPPPSAGGYGPAAGVGTAAPWAQATRMPGPTGPGIPYSQAPRAKPGSGISHIPPTTWKFDANLPKLGVATEPAEFPKGKPGTASNQFAITKAPWALRPEDSCNIDHMPERD